MGSKVRGNGVQRGQNWLAALTAIYIIGNSILEESVAGLGSSGLLPSL